MRGIDSYPENCRRSIRIVADKLHTDYETAYTAILIEAMLYDLHPSDDVIIPMILREEEPCGSG